MVSTCSSEVNKDTCYDLGGTPCELEIDELLIKFPVIVGILLFRFHEAVKTFRLSSRWTWMKYITMKVSMRATCSHIRRQYTMM
jgi:hypothetical protein